ncbi:plexin A3, partial [Tachysurus ichikawai]
LSVKVAHVPNLSAGVTCVFEDLSETPGEVLPKGQILCMSPSLRDVPTLTHGYGETWPQIRHAASAPLRKAHTHQLRFSFFLNQGSGIGI